MPCPSLRVPSHRVLKSLLMLSILVQGGCAAPPKPNVPPQAIIELPAVMGWFEGQVVHYVTTDTSDAAMATDMGVNFVPRLAYALGTPAGTPNAVERIYRFTNFEQGNVLPSAPVPTGPGNKDRAYSPVWVLVMVTWRAGQQPRILRSEEEVLAAQEKGQVSLQTTQAVVNCPVIITAQGGALRGARLVHR